MLIYLLLIDLLTILQRILRRKQLCQVKNKKLKLEFPLILIMS